MGRRNFEELKETYPKLWQKACKEFQQEKARKKYFLALIEIKKAKLEEQIQKEKERKRRTRALILFASNIIRKLESEELKELIVLTRDDLKAKEGKQQLDYLPFLLAEIREQHPDFEFTEPEETEEEAVADKKEKIREKLEKQFEEVAEKLAEDLEKKFPGFTREKR